jgi:hypothetical protein
MKDGVLQKDEWWYQLLNWEKLWEFGEEKFKNWS